MPFTELPAPKIEADFASPARLAVTPVGVTIVARVPPVTTTDIPCEVAPGEAMRAIFPPL